MNNHDYWNYNPPEPIEYILSQSLETDPNEISIYTIEEHIYEEKHERSFLDPEELRIMELIKNEGTSRAIII